MIHFKYTHDSNDVIDKCTCKYGYNILLPYLKTPYLNITNPRIDKPSDYYDI